MSGSRVIFQKETIKNTQVWILIKFELLCDMHRDMVIPLSLADYQGSI